MTSFISRSQNPRLCSLARIGQELRAIQKDFVAEALGKASVDPLLLVLGMSSWQLK